MWVNFNLLILYGASAAAFGCLAHMAPAAAVACCRGDRREQPHNQHTAAKPFRPLAPHKATALQTIPANQRPKV